MTIELRVLTGARAGHRARFEGATVTLGRHPQNDLQLDAELDRDVSSRHAELRADAAGGVVIADLASTNGTLVNGARITAPQLLRDGDIVQLGAEGPRVEVRLASDTGYGMRDAGTAMRDAGTAMRDAGSGMREVNEVSASRVPRSESDPQSEVRSPQSSRRPTAERVALAVRAETSKLKRAGLAAIAVLVAGVAGAYWVGSRESAAEVAEMRQLLASYDSTTVLLQSQLRGAADTAAVRRLQHVNDSLRNAAQRASTGSAEQRAAFNERVTQWQQGATAVAQVDIPAINERNAPAVAYLVTELGGQVLSGTAFAVDPSGLMVTNRHLVRTADGTPATRMAVKFRDQREWIAAEVVRVAPGQDDDLALIQLDHDGPVPAVTGFSRDAMLLREGSPVVTIGYPLGRSTLMQGEGDDFIAKTTLFPGAVSKSLPNVLQIAAFAGHGSSGSPVFDATGRVAGVVWGGPRESGGQLVYAVPAERVRAFVAGR